MKTVVVKAEIEVDCAACGKPLEASANGSQIDVEPCKTCMDEKHEEGMQDARDLERST